MVHLTDWSGKDVQIDRRLALDEDQHLVLFFFDADPLAVRGHLAVEVGSLIIECLGFGPGGVIVVPVHLAVGLWQEALLTHSPDDFAVKSKRLVEGDHSAQDTICGHEAILDFVSWVDVLALLLLLQLRKRKRHVMEQFGVVLTVIGFRCEDERTIVAVRAGEDAPLF